MWGTRYGQGLSLSADPNSVQEESYIIIPGRKKRFIVIVDTILHGGTY